MLVDLDLALPVDHVQFKRDDARQHLVGKVLAQAAPLRRVGRLVLPDELLEQIVLCRGLLDQSCLHLAMHGQVVPGGYTRPVGVHRRRHVGMRPNEGHERLGPRLQVAPVRVGPGAMAQQAKHMGQIRLLGLQLQVQGQMRDKRKAILIIGDQAGKGVRAHDARRSLRILGVELGREVHGRWMVIVERKSL